MNFPVSRFFAPIFQPVGNTKYRVRWMDRVQIQSSRQAISAGLSIILARSVILPFLQCWGSGSGFVGSICFSADPDPYQNVTYIALFSDPDRGGSESGSRKAKMTRLERKEEKIDFLKSFMPSMEGWRLVLELGNLLCWTRKKSIDFFTKEKEFFNLKFFKY